MTEIRLLSSFSGYLDEMETPQELFRSLRRADDFIRAAVIAAGRTLEVTDSEQGREDLGLVLATAYGTMQTNFGVLDQIIEGEQTSPTLFPTLYSMLLQDISPQRLTCAAVLSR